MLKNKLFTAFIAIILSVSAICSPVCAAESSSGSSLVEPCWANVFDAVVSAGFDGSTVWVSCCVTGAAGTKYQNGDIHIVKLTGSDAGEIKIWSGLSSSNSYFSFYDKSVTVSSSGTYRVFFRIYAVRNGVTDEIVCYKDLEY